MCCQQCSVCGSALQAQDDCKMKEGDDSPDEYHFDNGHGPYRDSTPCVVPRRVRFATAAASCSTRNEACAVALEGRKSEKAARKGSMKR